MTRGAEQLSWSADCKILRGRDPVELVRSPSSGLCRSSTSWRWCGSFTVRGPFLILVRIGGRPNHHVMVRRSAHSTSHRNTHSNTHGGEIPRFPLVKTLCHSQDYSQQHSQQHSQTQ